MDACNNRCVTCPGGHSGGRSRLMGDALYRRILEELAAAGKVRSHVPALQAEPLLDPQLPERIAAARRALGRRVELKLLTNGSLLTPGRAVARRAVFGCCPFPFYRLAVLWDGRVIPCCNDWSREVVVGDLSRQSLAEVWHGEPLNELRHLLWHGRNAESPVCAGCSYGDSFLG